MKDIVLFGNSIELYRGAIKRLRNICQEGEVSVLGKENLDPGGSEDFRDNGRWIGWYPSHEILLLLNILICLWPGRAVEVTFTRPCDWLRVFRSEDDNDEVEFDLEADQFIPLFLTARHLVWNWQYGLDECVCRPDTAQDFRPNEKWIRKNLLEFAEDMETAMNLSLTFVAVV